jgi:hypothetical protein
MNSRKTSVSLEDLLRVKRAEQPSPEFWADFDRQLRAKQLAAIVEPRPWWAPFIRFGSKVSHLQLPIGAAAVLAVTFVTFKDYRTPQVNSGYVPAIATQSVSMQEVVDTSNSLSIATPVQDASVEVSAPEVQSAAEPVLVASEEPAAPAAVSTLVAAEPSPSEKYIAANLAAAQAADPRLIDDVFGASMRQSEMVQPMRDPLAQVSAPGESRRSRLLATALPVSVNSTESVVAPSDRVARHLTEERLYDTITRVGLRGDRVAIKF